MKIVLKFLSFSFFMVLFGCNTYITKEEFSPELYSERPITILVLPPINNTTASDAKEYYSTTVSEPLANSGYYVLPIEVVNDILQQEGLFDTETLESIPLQKFFEYFGADAVLSVTLEKWDIQFLLTSGSVTVKVSCQLQSTHTGKILWYYDDEISVSTTGETGGAKGWAGLLVQVLTTAVKTATQSYIPIARKVNSQIFITLPFGKYHSEYDTDKSYQIKKK
ncbi:MAG: hypothetical protein FJ213_11810 [Ignavibacteria bacterium]|nr:hypothetical protein [Ignavibacteria bacterium]